MTLNLKSRFFQNIRLIDVFILAPIMIRAGMKVKNRSQFEKSFLVTAGIATLIFNGLNYITIAREN